MGRGLCPPVGHSRLRDELDNFEITIDNNNIDTKRIENYWDAFTLQGYRG